MAKQKRKPAKAKPITANPLFPAVVALWFGEPPGEQRDVDNARARAGKAPPAREPWPAND